MSLDTAKATVTLRSLTQKFDNKMRSATPLYPRICNIVKSNGADEEYGMLGNLPGIREWLGERKFKEVRAGRFTIVNKLWENSLLIAKTDIADDRMAMYGPLMEQLALEAAHHPDELTIETLLVGGESTACFDGQFFFDTDHVWGDSGSQSNDLTYNATDHTAVTVDEFNAAYHAAWSAMLGFKNDQGKYINRHLFGSSKNLMVVIPRQLAWTATKALTASLTANGGSNVVLDRPEIVISPYLTDGAKFYLLNLGAPLKPFVFQEREALSRQMKGMDDAETKDVKFMTQARYNAGYLAWWNAVLTVFN